ncbi:MAG: VWA domain-containing protein [Micavibrio sp.]|nr:VWA domain-containing protein [Micavibrio sp.]
MDSKEALKEVNRIAIGVNAELSDFYETLKNNIAETKAKAKYGTDKSREVKACPIIQQIDDDVLDDEEERQKSISTQKSIEKVIRENPNDFNIDVPEDDFYGGSKGSGEGVGRAVQINILGIPKWMQDIESAVKAKFERKKKRDWFDVEALVRGSTRKRKEMGMRRTDYVYFLLDVSGSMEYAGYKGRSLLSIFASYIPPMAKRFKSGMWVQVDGGDVITNELSDLSKGEIKELVLGGGSGADFGMAIEFIKNDIEKKKIKQNPIIIMATDGNEDFDFELLPNTIFVTTETGWSYANKSGLSAQGFPNALKGQKAIVINTD